MLRTLLILLLLVHGLIHAAAFRLHMTTPATIVWLTAGALLITAAVLVALHLRMWAIPAAIGIVLSQIVIILWWKDARFGTIANALLVVPTVVGLAGLLPGSSYYRFRQLAQDGLARMPPAPALVTARDLEPLPAAVQRYLRFSGVVGKPRVVNFRVTFRGGLAPSRDSALLPFTAEQISFVDQRTRLFFIESKRSGIPFDALHAYVGPHATMRVKLASLVTIVDAKGPKMDQSETVTMFNDMCFLAPATLIDPSIQWEELPDATVKGTFRNAGHTISAILSFNPDGSLANFVSQDRYQSADGKTYQLYPWATPIREYRDFRGVKIGARGDAVWHEPGGAFKYADMEVVDVRYNVTSL